MVSRALAFASASVMLGVLAVGCNRPPTTSEPQYRLVEVTRGDLTVEVTASGNLAYSNKEELSFGAGGTVGEVLIKEGDTVTEGQQLARLDEATVLSLEKAVTLARINLRDAEDALQELLSPSELEVAQAEAAVASARVNLETAEENLERARQPYDEADIAEAELALANARLALDQAQANYDRAKAQYESNPSAPGWERNYDLRAAQLAVAESNLAAAEEALAEMQAGADPLLVEQAEKQLAVARASLAQAEENLARISGEADPLEVELQQLEVARARAALDEALKKLEAATIVAPFAGVVLAVNVEPGQAVTATTPAIIIADSTSLEAVVLVNELDIPSVRVGDLAAVEVDAMAGVSFPAVVTRIAPTATAQQGVVNYRVTAELQAIEPPTAGQSKASPPDPTAINSVLDRAVASGYLTQEQADAMRERFSQGQMRITPEQLEQLIERFARMGLQFSPEQVTQFRERFLQKRAAPGNVTGMTPEDIQLREGLSVTVSIIIQQRMDVLLVPNQAVTLDGGKVYVNVAVGDAIERRPVITGLSDWQNTEIIEGLSEGELVAIPVSTSPGGGSEQTQPSKSSPFPGLRRFK